MIKLTAVRHFGGSFLPNTIRESTQSEKRNSSAPVIVRVDCLGIMLYNFTKDIAFATMNEIRIQ